MTSISNEINIAMGVMVALAMAEKVIVSVSFAERFNLKIKHLQF